MALPFTRILLATEHSEFDVGAEALAFALARRGGLPLAAVLPVAGNAEFEAVAPQAAAIADAKASARRERLEAAAAAQGLAFDLHTRHGPEPYREIVDEARERAADLIVIRRRGRPGLLANLLVGEMVSKVLAHAPCSVLVVPRAAKMCTRGVLVAVDPAAPDRAPVALAAALAAACTLPLQVVVVIDGQGQVQAEQVLARALAEARGAVPQVAGELLQGKPHQQIIAAAARHGADLIAVGCHGNEGFARAWIGGVAQKVIGLADCPVLVHATPLPAEASSS
jgi:nucleotide-binding universal stress UspA family protein